MMNGYNSSRTSYQDYPTLRHQHGNQHFEREKDVEVAQETNSRGFHVMGKMFLY